MRTRTVGSLRGTAAFIATLSLTAAPAVGQETRARATGPEGEARGGDAPPVALLGVRSRPEAIEPPPIANAASAPAATGWVRASDLPYLGAFFGSLAMVKPLEGLDRAIGGGDSDGRGADAAFASAGHVAGDLFVDLGLAGATALGGWISGSETATRVGLRSLEALIAVDALTTVFKVGIGRRRPYASPESDVFDPLRASSEFASFPSGHTSHAFVLAATVSRELGQVEWVPYVAYPLAGLVGASRIAGGSHWPTDVIAGAALGVFTARILGRVHGAGAEEPSLALAPVEGGVALGARLPGPTR